MVTNKPHRRGYILEETLHATNARMQASWPRRRRLDGAYVCMHHPSEGQRVSRRLRLAKPRRPAASRGGELDPTCRLGDGRRQALRVAAGARGGAAACSC